MRFSAVALTGLAALQAAASVVPVIEGAGHSELAARAPEVGEPAAPVDNTRPETGEPPAIEDPAAKGPEVDGPPTTSEQPVAAKPPTEAEPQAGETPPLPEEQDAVLKKLEQEPAEANVPNTEQCKMAKRDRSVSSSLVERSPTTFAEDQTRWVPILDNWNTHFKQIITKPQTQEEWDLGAKMALALNVRHGVVPLLHIGLFGGISSVVQGGPMVDPQSGHLIPRKTGDADMTGMYNYPNEVWDVIRASFAKAAEGTQLFGDASFEDEWKDRKTAIRAASGQNFIGAQANAGLQLYHLSWDMQVVNKLLKIQRKFVSQGVKPNQRDIDDVVYFLNQGNTQKGDRMTMTRLADAARGLGYGDARGQKIISDALHSVGKNIDTQYKTMFQQSSAWDSTIRVKFAATPMDVDREFTDGTYFPMELDGKTPSPFRFPRTPMSPMNVELGNGQRVMWAC